MFPLLRDDALPGPMSMHRLAEIGAIHQLDDDSAYLSEDAETLFGRANITNILKPFNTVSCAVSAAWVWLGGRFPDTIDVIYDGRITGTFKQGEVDENKIGLLMAGGE